MMSIRERLAALWREYVTSGGTPTVIYMSPPLFQQFESELPCLVREGNPPTDAEPQERHLLFKSARVYPRADAPPDSIYIMPKEIA